MIDADIQGALDNISHTHLLEAIGQFPARELIKQWLKAGYVKLGRLHETPAGTPQIHTVHGGIEVQLTQLPYYWDTSSARAAPSALGQGAWAPSLASTMDP